MYKCTNCNGETSKADSCCPLCGIKFLTIEAWGKDPDGIFGAMYEEHEEIGS